MAQTVRFVRDALHVDAGAISALRPPAQPGDTLVFAGREVTLSALVADFNFVIAAERLTVSPQAATTLTGVGSNPSPSVTVSARIIEGPPLVLTCAGMQRTNGTDGDPGESGIVERDGGGRRIFLPGGDGENGADGEPGGTAGHVLVRYGTASHPPTATVPGGAGGKGGQGGQGGRGRPPGRRGRDGRDGTSGLAGTVDIAEADATAVWSVLDAETARQWAAYRAEVAGFFFRKFDPRSQRFAFEEAQAALLLNPADPDATTIRDRIANRQIPSGLARDLDVAPDFRGLSADLTSEISVVQSSFAAYVAVATLESIAESIRDSLGLMATQLANRKLEAQAEIAIAQRDVQIVQAEIANIQVQISDLDKQMEAIRNSRFTIGSIISDVASIATVVGGMATGVGAIVSVAGGLATLQRVSEGLDLVTILKFLEEKPDPNSARSEDLEEVKELGGDLEDLLKGGKSLISFSKVLANLEGAMSLPGQDAIGKVLKQQVLLVRQKMVASLRESQARSRVAAAELRKSNLASEIEAVQERLAHWQADAASLSAATDLLITSAREIVDMVMEDVFVAQRAREIYQLIRIPDLRFDFGYLHPDEDRALTPATRASSSLTSLSGMAIQVLAWSQIYAQLNRAQIGFDVIHPQLSVAITDPSTLQRFAGGAALEFSLEVADAPRGMFELKVNALRLDMTGASAAESANIWIIHSGRWRISRRTDGSVTDMLLLPRSEVFACSPGTGTLTARIPTNPQPASEPGPPFSFWGRGVATTFRLQQAEPLVIDLSQLTAIQVIIDCIGYAPQGSGPPEMVRPLAPDVRAVPAVAEGGPGAPAGYSAASRLR